jgi:hypothetical protein
MVASPPTIPANRPGGAVPSASAPLSDSHRLGPAGASTLPAGQLRRAAESRQPPPNHPSQHVPAGQPGPPGLVVRNVKVRPSDPEIRVP